MGIDFLLKVLIFRITSTSKPATRYAARFILPDLLVPGRFVSLNPSRQFHMRLSRPSTATEEISTGTTPLMVLVLQTRDTKSV